MNLLSKGGIPVEEVRGSAIAFSASRAAVSECFLRPLVRQLITRSGEPWERGCVILDMHGTLMAEIPQIMESYNGDLVVVGADSQDSLLLLQGLEPELVPDVMVEALRTIFRSWNAEALDIYRSAFEAAVSVLVALEQPVDIANVIRLVADDHSASEILDSVDTKDLVRARAVEDFRAGWLDGYTRMERVVVQGTLSAVFGRFLPLEPLNHAFCRVGRHTIADAFLDGKVVVVDGRGLTLVEQKIVGCCVKRAFSHWATRTVIWDLPTTFLVVDDYDAICDRNDADLLEACSDQHAGIVVASKGVSMLPRMDGSLCDLPRQFETSVFMHTGDEATHTWSRSLGICGAEALQPYSPQPEGHRLQTVDEWEIWGYAVHNKDSRPSETSCLVA